MSGDYVILNLFYNQTNMEPFITQKEETCSRCGKEIERGEWALLDNFDDTFVCNLCEEEGDDEEATYIDHYEETIKHREENNNFN